MTQTRLSPVRKIRAFVGTTAGSRLLLFGAIALFLAILAPFGTDGIGPFWARGLYWSIMIYGGAAISIATSTAWTRIFNHDASRPFSIHMIGLVVATAIPITAMVAGLGALFSRMTTGIELTVLYLYVVTITAAVTFGTTLIDQSRALKAALSDAEEQARAIHVAHKNKTGDTPPELFAARLHIELRNSDLISLSADDHYLDVATSGGHEQIRCTLADAASELSALDGRVIHRSHWVAKSAIEKVVRTGSRTFIRLKDGRDLPVSRTRLRNLQKENWLPKKNRPISGETKVTDQDAD